MSIMLKLIAIACSLIGFMSASHLATILVRQRFVRAVDMTKIGTVASVLVGSTAILWPPTSHFDVWIRLFTPLMTSLLFAFLLANRRQARIEKELPNWLASLIMKMRSGYSLQTALEQELRRNNAATRFHLNSIFRAVSFSPQTKSDRHVSTPHLILPPMIFGIAEEFRRINFLPNRQIEELQRWRDRLLVLESFRRKSKQAMSQARTQAVVLALIYFSLFVFLCIAFSWEHVRAATKVSIPLFLLGCWWIWHGGGRIKWTI